MWTNMSRAERREWTRILKYNRDKIRRERHQGCVDYIQTLAELPKSFGRDNNWRIKLRGWSPY